MTIQEFLFKTGNYSNLSGFKPLCRAVEIVKAKKGKIYITKELYPQLAKEFDTTPSKIERSMRFIIQERISVAEYRKLLGMEFVPSNSELIFYFASLGGRK